MKTVLKYIFTFLVIVLALFLSSKTVSAATASTPRSIRVIVSWQDGDKSALSEFKTFAMSAVAAPDPVEPPPVLSLTQNGNGSVAGTVSGNLVINTSNSSRSATYNATTGAQVMLTAAEDSGWTFGGWTGCVADNTDSKKCIVTMNGNQNVTAIFTDNNSTNRLLTLSQTGTGTGSISGTEGISTNNANPSTTKTYSNNKVVILTANPSNSTVVWSGCDSVSGGGGNICNIKMDAPEVITATFTPITHNLTLNRAGAGAGSVTGPGINLTSNASPVVKSFTQGETVTLTANPSNSTIAWTGGCAGSSTTCSIIMDGSKTVTATFTPVAATTYTLTIKQKNNGTGQGAVTGQVVVAGVTYKINSSSVTAVTVQFPKNTVVPLVVTPSTLKLSHFDGWTTTTGDPTNIWCTGTTSPCSVTMAADRIVTAEFGETTCNGVIVYTAINMPNGQGECLSPGTYENDNFELKYLVKSIKVPTDHSAIISEGTYVSLTEYAHRLVTESVNDTSITPSDQIHVYEIESMKVCSTPSCPMP